METTRDNSLDAGLLSSEEKQALYAAELPAPAQNPIQRKRKGLSPYAVVALVVGVLLTLGVALGPRMSNCMRHHAAKVDGASFSQLLDSANPESLRQLLHDRLPEKYGKGIFPSDKDTMEAVHEDDAPLATKIVKLAARQDDNNSTSEEPGTTTSDEETTTDEPTETPTSDEDDETTTSDEEEPTTTTDDPETSPTSDPSDDDNDDGTSLSDYSSTTGSDEPTSSSPSTPSSSLTSSSSGDQEPSSSSKEDEKTTSKGSTVTSTDSEGNAVTITSYADAEQPTNDDDDDDEEDPDLQDAGARPAVALLPVLGAVAGAAFML